MAILILLFTFWSILYVEKIENRIIRIFFNWVPPILLAYIIPAVIALLVNKDFSQISLHKINTRYLVPLAVLMVMSTFKLSQLKIIGVKPLLVFISGSFFISLFPIVYFGVSDLFQLNLIANKEVIWKAIPPIVGSWIGGSTSQVVLKEVVACPENLFISVLVLDNILVNAWTICMLQFIKHTTRVQQWLGLPHSQEIRTLQKNTGTKMNGLAAILILVFLVAILSFLNISFIQRITLLSIIGLSLPILIKNWNIDFMLKQAHIPIVCIMIILGFKLRFEQVHMDASFILFLIIWLVGHIVFMTIITWLLKANAVWIAIGSMANVGGISTAPAVTSVYNKQLMPYAILLAVMSMVTGTLWGGITIWLFRYVLGYN